MGRYIKKDVRSKWSENDMSKAVTAVKNGMKLNTAVLYVPDVKIKARYQKTTK